jgi:hypothetical protein
MNPAPLEMRQKVGFEGGIYKCNYILIFSADEENNKGIGSGGGVGGGGCCAVGQDSTIAHRRVNILN